MFGNSSKSTFMPIVILIAYYILTSQDAEAFSHKISKVSDTSLFMSSSTEQHTTRRGLFSSVVASTALLSPFLISPTPAYARLEAVNRPDLLPKESGVNVIQVEKFLTTGQAKRMNDLLTNLERDTGFRVRVLCQAYPQTPGLAIRDYWSLGKEVSVLVFSCSNLFSKKHVGIKKIY